MQEIMLAVINPPGATISSATALRIMTHHKLGVALGLALQLLLLMLLEAASGGGKETTGSDTGGHYDDGLGISVGVAWLLWEVGVDRESREGSLQRGSLDLRL